MLVYLLCERLWDRDLQGRLFDRGDQHRRPIRVYLNPVAAEQERRKRERAARSGVNPFKYGSQLTDWTTFGPHQLFDWILDAGLEPLPVFEPTQDQCIHWWNRESRTMTESQLEHLWEALNLIRFFEVCEEEV
jgi:hypothetical protein